MVSSLLIALTFAATALALGYVDYDGSTDYDSPPSSRKSEDYHDHVHHLDASASLDYKYEEQPNVKTDKTLSNLDSELWPQTVRKQREYMETFTKRSRRDQHDNYDEDEIPNLKKSSFLKHRSRHKTGDILDEDILPRRVNVYNRDRKDTSKELDGRDEETEKDYIQEDKIKDFDVESMFGDITKKKIKRRTPRDKQFTNQQKRALHDNPEQVLEGDTQNIFGLEKQDKVGYSDNVVQRLENAKQRNAHYRPVTHQEDAIIPSGNNKVRAFDEYEGYYDMKRLNDVKNNLSTQPQQTTVKVPVANMSLPYFPMSRPRLTEAPSDRPERTSTSSLMSGPRITRSDRVERRTKTNKTIITTSGRGAKRARIRTTKATTSKKEIKKQQQLSMAEKSRLSIMKKARRYEGGFNQPPKKPPVLMQVTSHVPTLVMVEPPSSTLFNFAIKPTADSPNAIKRVKSLMRKKLVANAKSIHDLTENWDALVCDYVDTRVLDGTDSKALPIVRNIFLLVLSLCLDMFVIN